MHVDCSARDGSDCLSFPRDHHHRSDEPRTWAGAETPCPSPLELRPLGPPRPVRRACSPSVSRRRQARGSGARVQQEVRDEPPVQTRPAEEAEGRRPRPARPALAPVVVHAGPGGSSAEAAAPSVHSGPVRPPTRPPVPGRGRRQGWHGRTGVPSVLPVPPGPRVPSGPALGAAAVRAPAAEDGHRKGGRHERGRDRWRGRPDQIGGPRVAVPAPSDSWPPTGRSGSAVTRREVDRDLGLVSVSVGTLPPVSGSTSVVLSFRFGSFCCPWTLVSAEPSTSTGHNPRKQPLNVPEWTNRY